MDSVMSNQKRVYSLWTSPRSEWVSPIDPSLDIDDVNKILDNLDKAMIEEVLNKVKNDPQLKMFERPLTPIDLNQSTGW